MNTWGVVVAGGSGVRYGRLKQLDLLAGRRVLDWAVDVIRPSCDGVVVVPASLISEVDVPGVEAIVSGGETRSDSVRAGLAAVGNDATHILVHDAARPLASTALVTRIVDALATGAAGVVPVVAVSESLRTVDGDPVDRARFVTVQTPQGFEVGALRSAHASTEVATDDASLLDRLGLGVVHVAGEATNLKITEPHDLPIAAALLHGD